MTNIRHYLFDEIALGQKESFSVEITERMMDSFLSITGDINPLHCDEEYARMRKYQGKVVYGMLTASFLSTLAGVYLPGEKSLLQCVEVGFSGPVYVHDILTFEGEVIDKREAFHTIEVKVVIRNQDSKKVCTGKIRIGVTE
ncbi:MAG: MaoC/PaaZ C-terminal domain-containing protein [Sphaerochaetaceae bacterium]